MDWRLIAAISAAAGCFVAVGAYGVFTHDPAPRQTAAPVPMLLSEYRFAVTTTPSPVRAQPRRRFGPDSSAQSPFAPQGSDTVPSSAPPSLAVEAQVGGVTTEAAVDFERIRASAPAGNAVRHRPHGGPPAVEKSPAFPELHTSRYRGVLTAAGIVRVKSRSRLTPDQERARPPVEAALAKMGRQQIALIRRGQEPHISEGDWPPGRAVAGPLLQTLRPDQMEAVRTLCRSLGCESVASMI